MFHLRKWKKSNGNDSRKRRSYRSVRPLSAEALESKRLLAGDISLVLDGDVLFVEGTGTPMRDVFTIRNTDVDDVQVEIVTAGMVPDTVRETYDIPTLEALALFNDVDFGGFRMRAGDGDDTLDASALKFHSNALLFGGGGDDELMGGKLADEMHGGAGHDLLTNADHLDTALTGGDGWDQLMYRGVSLGATLEKNEDIEDITGTKFADHFDSSEADMPVTVRGRDGDDVIVGSRFDDELLGGRGADIIEGRAGADEIRGNDGDDTLNAGKGDDMVWGNAGNDEIFGGYGRDDLRGGPGDDMLVGGGNDDILRGGPGNDELFGGHDNDTLRGNDGDDYLVGGSGADILNGGADIDKADYEGSFAGVSVELGGTGTGGDAEGDTLVDVEDLCGSLFDDTLIGEGGKNVIDGSDGNDVIHGKAGDDMLMGGAGDDNILGQAGDDVITGGADNDTLDGDGLDDGMPTAGTATGDIVMGEAGDDVLFSGNPVGMAGYDADFPDTLMGGPGNDTLNGDDGQDNLFGEAGNDILNGFDNPASISGADILDGGADDDTLDGGAGADYQNGGTGIDTITTEYAGPATIWKDMVDYAVFSGSEDDTFIIGGAAEGIQQIDAQTELDLNEIFNDYTPGSDTLLFKS